ncbi:MAG: IPTL-CTERM sorting domain-containing protein [candidate division Zixibacteria bacterium]|nr:IPTL-CTERM sorting domain-containing protein [candidate division Zixibacteria bacterium]
MKIRMLFGLAVGLACVSGLMMPGDALAGKVNAKVWYWHGINYYGNTQIVNDYGTASRYISTTSHGKKGYADAYERSYYSNGFKLVNHEWAQDVKGYNFGAKAWHTGSSGPSPINANEADLACCPDTIPPPPIPGDTVTTEYFKISYSDASGGIFDIDIDSVSFLQVYLDDVVDGDSVVKDWKLNINGEVSHVVLRGIANSGGEDYVTYSKDGRFAEFLPTLTEYPNRVYVLRFGAMHFTAPGTVEGSDLEIASGQEPPDAPIPTLTEWGLIIFAVLLVGFMTWVVVRRRRRVTIGI